MTPQARWQRFRYRLPRLGCWQQIALAGGMTLLLLGFIVFVLPYVLPLRGGDADPAQLADPDGQFITVDGIELYYIHQANPQGEAVILVHGFNSATVVWQAVMPRLHRAGYDVYALDLPGLGLSEKNLDLDMGHPAQAEIITALMDSLEIKSAHMVGHSMGGNILLHLSLDQPDRVRTLALAAPSLVTASSEGLPPALLDFPPALRWSRVILRWMIPATTEIQLESAAYLDEAITDELVMDYNRTFDTPDWELAWLALARDAAGNSLPASLDALTMPVIILWGEEDPWIPYAEGETLEADIPQATLVPFLGTGHLPMHEAPVSFSDVLIAFWDAQDSR